MNLETGKQLVYICSPFFGKTLEEEHSNIKLARKYIEYISKKYQCKAVSPQAILSDYFDYRNPDEFALCIRFRYELINKCKKMFVCGDVISDDMKKDINLAEKLGIAIVYENAIKRPSIRITIEFEGD